MSQLPEGQELTPSLLFIYFMVGMIIGVFLTIVILTLLRPHLPPEALWVKALVFAPLVAGVFCGARVTSVARPQRLRLGAALKAAFTGSRGA